MTSTAARRHQSPFLTEEDNVFWGAPFSDEDLQAERVTLDRGILDWPGYYNRQSTTREHAEGSSTVTHLPSMRLADEPALLMPYTTGTYGMLPSVAAITAFDAHDESGQLELPSLMLGGVEVDGRSGGHFLGFDELLS